MPRLVVIDNSPRRAAGGAGGAGAAGGSGGRAAVDPRASPVRLTADTPHRNATPLRTKAPVGTRRASALKRGEGGGGNAGGGGAPANADAAGAVVPKSAASRAVILAELAKHFVIQQLPRAVHGQLADAMAPQQAGAGDAVITQGDVGTRFFVLESGAVDVEVDGAVVSSLRAPASFGELALLHAAPRAATVRATAPCRLWGVDRPLFKHFVASQAAAAASEKLALLRKVDILQPLTMAQMAAVAEAVEEQEYAAGQDIVTQGDRHATHFFIIAQGRVDVLVDGKNMATLHDGQFFGEHALLVEEPRNATCRCASAVTTCYTLSRGHFESILGSLQALREISAQRDAVNQEKRRRAAAKAARGGAFAGASAGGGRGKARDPDAAGRGSSDADGPAGGDVGGVGAAEEEADAEGAAGSRRAKTVDEVVRELDASLELRHFMQIRTIAVGQRGRVRAVQRRKAKKRHPPGVARAQLYALKSFSKVKVLEAGAADDVINELVATAQLRSPFCVRLLQRFHDANCVYMLTNLVRCGDMFSLLYSSDKPPRCRLQGLDLNLTRFYATNVILGLEHVHSLGYAFRNLLPESIALGADGYVQLVNFSMAKFLPQGSKTHTLLGQAEYFAPEQVLCQGHDQGVDFYALGCCLYEMMCAAAPFSDPDQSRVFVKILNSHRFLKFPPFFPSTAKKLILGLLEPKPFLRLGRLKAGIRDVKLHPWFDGVDWRRVAVKAYGTEVFRPRVHNELDLSYFGNFEEEPAETFRGDNALFKGF